MPDASRPLKLCNDDGKIITTAICYGLQRYTIRCIHPAQRCISTKQMIDNIFEVETTALAHLACAPQESGIHLTDFAAAHTSVNSSWIFRVLEKAELPRFIRRFLRSIHVDSNTEVEFAGKVRGHFFMARGVRQGCPASGFLFALDPIFPMDTRIDHPKRPCCASLPPALSVSICRLFSSRCFVFPILGGCPVSGLCGN